MFSQTTTDNRQLNQTNLPGSLSIAPTNILDNGRQGVNYSEYVVRAKRSPHVQAGTHVGAGSRSGYNPKDESEPVSVQTNLDLEDKNKNEKGIRSKPNLNKKYGKDNSVKTVNKENTNEKGEFKKYRRDYKIENTVSINLEGKNVTVDELVYSIEQLCGIGTLLACVATTNEMYDLTMVNQECKEMLSEESEDDETDEELANDDRSDEADISGEGTENENETNNSTHDKMYPILKEANMDFEQAQINENSSSKKTSAPQKMKMGEKQK
ncbi:hypothetical protein ScPMuIL_008366 [Solemya velum]